MAESIVQVTEGSGKKLHTFQRTIGANNVEDEIVVQGAPYLATYRVPVPLVVTATGNSHMLQLMAGSTLNVRVHFIRVRQAVAAAAVAAVEIDVWRLSSAGTGGTVVTPAKADTADAASGATAMTLPTAKGTETTLLWGEVIQFGTAALLAATLGQMEWVQTFWEKPIIIPAGTTNGIAVKNIAALATAQVSIQIGFSETSFL